LTDRCHQIQSRSGSQDQKALSKLQIKTPPHHVDEGEFLFVI